MQTLEAADARMRNDIDLVNRDMRLVKGLDGIERSLHLEKCICCLYRL